MKKTLTLLIVFAAGACSCLGQNTQFVGDTADGSRAVAVHLIRMYDEFDHLILPDDRPVFPYSPKQTCRKCHDYGTISRGWHFNWADSGVAAGREGEPWIFVHPMAATQVPVSTRPWQRTFPPSSFGLTSFEFLSRFGRHLPGGGPGERESLQDAGDYMRWQVSGNLEVNCQSCHNGDPAQNQAEYGVQVLRQNFRWAPTAGSGFGNVRGSAADMPDNFDRYSAVPPEASGALPPTVTYDRSRFDESARVLFSVPRRMPPSQCYFCHSSKVVDPRMSQRWESDGDVHIEAGMACVDCHRNGIDHQIVRGYEGEGGPGLSAASLTCKGCHLGIAGSSLPGDGRRRAPVPTHRGIPPVHFEKLTCTTCHSGPWPQGVTLQMKTSRAHGLGIPKADKTDEALPHIATPVFVRRADGIYEPRSVVWPAFWARARHDSLVPIPPEQVAEVINIVLKIDTNRVVGRWPRLTNVDVSTILGCLKDTSGGFPVYVVGGMVYSQNREGVIVGVEQPAAQPYSWPIAHDVRPKGQSLGIRGCDDCHSAGAPLFFGSVRVTSPFLAVQDSMIRMTTFQDQSPIGQYIFSLSFLFRTGLKIVVILGFLIITMVLLLYAGRGVWTIIRALNPESQ